VGEGGEDKPPDPNLDELEALWEHPFVYELRDFFGTNSVEQVYQAVNRYIERNMYDESALETDS
jgi:hypothetical protein